MLFFFQQIGSRRFNHNTDERGTIYGKGANLRPREMYWMP